MEIKFQKALNEYKYLVMIDLASHKSGFCLWDIQNNCPVQTMLINVKNGPVDLFHQLIDLFENIKDFQKITNKDLLVYTEAMPTQVGGGSTIQTFLALAKSHAILELFLSEYKYDTYDQVGVYPISSHAYYRKLYNLDNKTKVDKDLIKNHNINKYTNCDLSHIGYDESDAIFLAETFCNYKWNKDIDAEIKEIKKHKKTLKASHAIQACDDKIEFLLSIKNISKEENNG